MPLPPDLQKELESFRCSKCAQTAELPHKPKLVIRPDPTPNLVVLLDVIPNRIHDMVYDMLVMIVHGHMLFRFLALKALSEQTAFNFFLSSQISTLSALTYIVVDRGSNLQAELIKRKLHDVESQLFLFLPKLLGGIGLNDGYIDIYTKVLTDFYSRRTLSLDLTIACYYWKSKLVGTLLNIRTTFLHTTIVLV